MKYDYKARFVPTGVSDPEKASKTKISSFVSDNHTPTADDKKQGEIALQKLFDDPYVARNYWELHDFLIEYKNPPWGSIDNLQEKIRDFTRTNRYTRVGSKYEKYVSIDHDPSVTSDEIAEFLRSEFDIKIDEKNQIEEVSDTTTNFYTAWSIKM